MRIIKITERPDLVDVAANWFSSKWHISLQAYKDSMQAAINGDKIHQWYLCLDDNDIIMAGCGEIENDFHDRPDLSPNICAVYTEPEYRNQGIAGKLLNYAVEDNKSRSISPVYLITMHTSFYERYGWKYVCDCQGEGDKHPSRMYKHD